MKKIENFDLTNSKGIQKIAELIYPLAISNPTLFLAKYAIDKFTDLTKSWETQKDVIEKLIKRGKNEGVDEMEITIQNSRGLKLNIPAEEAQIDTVIGSDEKMHIRVKYK